MTAWNMAIFIVHRQCIYTYILVRCACVSVQSRKKWKQNAEGEGGKTYLSSYEMLPHEFPSLEAFKCGYSHTHLRSQTSTHLSISSWTSFSLSLALSINLSRPLTLSLSLSHGITISHSTLWPMQGSGCELKFRTRSVRNSHCATFCSTIDWTSTDECCLNQSDAVNVFQSLLPPILTILTVPLIVKLSPDVAGSSSMNTEWSMASNEPCYPN